MRSTLQRLGTDRLHGLLQMYQTARAELNANGDQNVVTLSQIVEHREVLLYTRIRRSCGVRKVDPPERRGGAPLSLFIGGG
jgi:hypothetical protein